MINLLFTRPFHHSRMGGVTVFVKQLISNLDERFVRVVNMLERKRGAQPTLEETWESSFVESGLRLAALASLFARFGYLVKKYDVNIVHSNPSFGLKPIFREALFVLMSKLNGIKIVVFIHGWHADFEEKLIRSNMALRLFRKIYNQADGIIVLSRKFEQNLSKMGITTRIYTETTMVDDDLLADFDIKKKIASRNEDGKSQILFLARVEKDKGVFETVRAVEILTGRGYDIELVIAGEGSHKKYIEAYLEEKGMRNCHCIGYVKGTEKARIFMDSDIYCLPSYHEGLPISMLEAMAFGLPIVTRRVGAIEEFFKNGKHGLITDSKDAGVIAGLLLELLEDAQLRKTMAKYNYEWAKSNVWASIVSRRVLSIYEEVLSGSG